MLNPASISAAMAARRQATTFCVCDLPKNTSGAILWALQTASTMLVIGSAPSWEGALKPGAVRSKKVRSPQRARRT